MTTATFRKTWVELAKTMSRQEFVLRYVEAFTARAEDRELTDDWQLIQRDGMWVWGARCCLAKGCNANFGSAAVAFDNVRRSVLCRLTQRAEADRIWAVTGL